MLNDEVEIGTFIVTTSKQTEKDTKKCGTDAFTIFIIHLPKK